MAIATRTGPTTHSAEIHTGITTSWLSMPTSWSNPPDCSTRYYGQDLGAGYFNAFDPYLIPPGKAPCQPDAVFTWWRQDSLTGLGGDYSTSVSLWANNFNCPDAYTTASTYVLDISSTQILCCPSAYQFFRSYSHGSIGQCGSLVPSGTVVTVYETSSDWVAVTGIVLQDINVYGVQVNGWTFSHSTVSSTAITSSARQASDMPSTSPSSSRNGDLSASAKIGIGVGSGGVTLAIIALILGLLVWRRFKRRKPDNTEANSVSGVSQGDQSWDKSTAYSHGRPSSAFPQLQGAYHEMEQQVGPYELSDSNSR